MTVEDRIRRLLRWYPREWRTANEEVVVATMLDAADAAGRSTPSHAERRAVVVEGLGMRLDVRFALGAGALALLLASVAGAASFWGASAAALPLTLVVVPIVVAIGLLALFRSAGLVSAGRALIAAGLTIAAFILSGMTAAAWSLGFDAADEGVPAAGLGALWMPLFATAWLVGALALGVVAAGMLARARMPRPLALATAGIAGIVAAPAIGVATISTVTSLAASAALCIVSLVVFRRSRGASTPAVSVSPTASTSRRPLPARTRRTASALAWVSAAGSLVGIVYALTGAGWSSAATDGTVAMGQGITIGLLSGLPLLAAISLTALAGRTHSIAATIGPMILFALSLGAVIVAYLRAPSWDAMAPILAVSAALGGAGIAWLLAARLPGTPLLRLTFAVLIGLGYATFLGGMLGPAIAFLMPAIAVPFAIAIGRDRSRVRGTVARPDGVAPLSDPA